jgi:tetratricopeptide (TPR) repeat protein
MPLHLFQKVSPENQHIKTFFSLRRYAAGCMRNFESSNLNKMKTLAKHNKPTARTQNEIYAKGMKLMDRKKYASAQKNFDIILLLDPNHVDAMLQRGICKMHAGLVNLALDDFSEILMLADERPEAYAAMAEAYWMLADYEMARNFIEQALKSTYALRSEWYELACNIHSKLNDIDKAYSCINRAIVCNPFEAVLYYKRARLLFRLDKIQVAINDLNKAISFEPKFASALKLRAECKLKMGDKDGATRDRVAAGLYYKA